MLYSSDSDCMSDLVAAVDRAGRTIHVVPYEVPDQATPTWLWYDWKSFFSTHFRKLRGISKLYHFRLISLSYIT